MKKYLKQILLGLGVLFGALVLALMAAPGVIGNYLGSTFSVYELLSFGDEARVGMIIALVLSVLALLDALLLLCLKLMNKKFAYGKICAFVGVLMAVATGVLLLLTVSLSGVEPSLYSLGVGAILSAVFSFVCAVCLLGYALLPNKKSKRK